MEIQAFFLAEQITRLSPGRHDVRRAVLSVLDCTPDTLFPVRFTLPALIVLRRENTAGEVPIRMRFDLVDEDGRLAGLPRRWMTESVFADRNRILYLMAKIDFEFPRPGRYRLDIAYSDELEGGEYHYAIDIMPREDS